MLVVVLWAPIPFGGVLPLDRGLLQVAAFLALAVTLALGGRDVAAAMRPSLLPAAALAAVGALGLLQAMPWPAFVAAALSPRGTAVWQAAGEILAPGAEAGSGAIPLSLAPAVSYATALHWLALAATLLAATALGSQRGPRRLLAGTILAGALFQVVYGADRWFQAANTIWGVEVPGDVGRLRGSFVNPDHLALYLAMAIALVAAASWWGIRRQRYETMLERRLMYAAPPVLLFVPLFVGLGFTGSRAGLAAGALALLVQASLVARHYRSTRMLVYGAVGVTLGFAAIALFGLRAGLGRWLDTSIYELTWNARLVVYRTTLDLWLDFPLLGTGLGTFREALPLAQTGALQGTWQHAHNDYLELLATTGLIGLPLVLVGALVMGRRLIAVLEGGRRSEDRAAGLAALGALAAAAAISAVDFGLTTPANAFTLAAICGLAGGAPTGRGARRSRADGQEPSAAATRPSERNRTAPG